MPRKERRTNNVQKELAKAGSSAGQTKITDTFFATSICGRSVGGNAARNVSVRSPNAKDVDTNDNLNTGDGIPKSMLQNFFSRQCNIDLLNVSTIPFFKLNVTATFLN